MTMAGTIGWIAIVLPLVSCAELPWRSYAAAPPSPRRAALPTTERIAAPTVTLDATHEYSLIELIDVAQRANPDTREAWEQARAAAARLGITEAVYLPVLALAVTGGVRRNAYPSTDRAFSASGPFVEPRLELTWTLLDLPRFADVDVARALVQEASFAFSRRHQEVMFGVARAFYALDASHARLESAQATLRTAIVDEEAAQARLQVGLATRPELLLAHETRARAAYDVEAAAGTVRASEATLAAAVGAAPLFDLRITRLDAQRLPERLGVPVQQILETTLRQRPDLQALAASLRAREAEVRRARGSFAPQLSLWGDVDYQGWRFETDPSGSPPAPALSAYEFDAHLRIDWNLFAGFAQLNALRAAEAERQASAATLTGGALRALREAWTAYFDVQTAQRKLEFAQALLAAAEEAHAATLETYRRGLGTLIDLLTAERDLANARTTLVESRAELLTAAAALALAVGAAPATVEPPSLPGPGIIRR
jgi:outer membrane protein TolC